MQYSNNSLSLDLLPVYKYIIIIHKNFKLDLIILLLFYLYIIYYFIFFHYFMYYLIKLNLIKSYNLNIFYISNIYIRIIVKIIVRVNKRNIILKKLF